MNKAYARTYWENYPSDVSPVNKTNLNNIEVGVDEIDNRVITLDTTKATKVEVSTLVQDVDFEENTGIFTITKKNGAVLKLDTKMEKIAVNFSYDKSTQQIVLTLIDGTKQYIDLSALIAQFEFIDTATIGFGITSDGKVKATVLDGSITEDKLRPNYLADIKVEVAKTQASASAAATSELNAKTSETNASSSASTASTKASAASTSATNSANSATKAESYAVGGTGTRTGEDTDNAKYYSQSASGSASSAATSASTASTKATNAASSASSASSSASSASTSKTNAANSATAAANSASAAAASATKANNYANGSTNSAKYYYEQAKSISESFAGALRPMGTVTFANLPAISSAVEGDMYNISNEFTTTSDFKEGAGNVVPAGTNVYKTADGKWDILAGTPVTGVKGNAESSYRRGNVNITPENIGALPEDGNAVSATKAIQDENGNNIVATYQTKTGNTNNNSVTFTTADSASPTEWTDVEQMKSGEKHSSLFNKISAMFKNVRWLYKMLGTTDISSIGDGTCTGAIESCFQSVSDGKAAVATALTNQGVATASNATFDTMASNVTTAGNARYNNGYSAGANDAVEHRDYTKSYTYTATTADTYITTTVYPLQDIQFASLKENFIIIITYKSYRYSGLYMYDDIVLDSAFNLTYTGNEIKIEIPQDTQYINALAVTLTNFIGTIDFAITVITWAKTRSDISEISSTVL